MNKRCMSTEHLRGLQRISPCCGYPINHPVGIGVESYEMSITIACTNCSKVVKEHWLINDKGEIVWPPPQEWVDRQPPAKKRKRCRRRVLLEQEPEGYRVIF